MLLVVGANTFVYIYIYSVFWSLCMIGTAQPLQGEKKPKVCHLQGISSCGGCQWGKPNESRGDDPGGPT